jgi:hypothetical protein
MEVWRVKRWRMVLFLPRMEVVEAGRGLREDWAGGEGEVGGGGGGERRERLTGTGADVRTPFMKTEKDETLLQRRLNLAIEDTYWNKQQTRKHLRKDRKNK